MDSAATAAVEVEEEQVAMFIPLLHSCLLEL
jgi:hypothetical protein